MDVGVVIPVGKGRLANLDRVLGCLEKQTMQPEAIVVVGDGLDALDGLHAFDVSRVVVPKHQPGDEQPRNIGVRALLEVAIVTHVWFLDSDVIFEEDCLEELWVADAAVAEPRILVAPYDWLGPGMTQPAPEVRNDPRWPSFEAHHPAEVVTGDLSAGLACFSGNLVWPIDEFQRVGGFWNELHHGRCEDGELGLRAVAMGVPISFAGRARGWHLWHPVDSELIHARNQRDVPMLNARHPWVQDSGIVMSDEDGKRFDVRCPGCDERINTGAWWAHAVECGVVSEIPIQRGDW